MIDFRDFCDFRVTFSGAPRQKIRAIRVRHYDFYERFSWLLLIKYVPLQPILR